MRIKLGAASGHFYYYCYYYYQQFFVISLIFSYEKSYFTDMKQIKNEQSFLLMMHSHNCLR